MLIDGTSTIDARRGTSSLSADASASSTGNSAGLTVASCLADCSPHCTIDDTDAGVVMKNALRSTGSEVDDDSSFPADAELVACVSFTAVSDSGIVCGTS